MKLNDDKICENVWGADDFNPFEIKVTAGEQGVYGSYLGGLPEYDAEELKESYSCIKEFSRMAIENKFCRNCRFPWIDAYRNCTCGQHEKYKENIKNAEVAAITIENYNMKHVREWASQIEKDLDGDSEYARLNRKAREIMTKRIARYHSENAKIPQLNIIKKNCRKWLMSIAKWFRPSYWKWYFGTPKAERIKSIPIYAATDDKIKDLSFGNQKVSSGNCCIRTKSGCVVVVPASMVNDLKDRYKGSVIVAPIIKE